MSQDINGDKKPPKQRSVSSKPFKFKPSQTTLLTTNKENDRPGSSTTIPKFLKPSPSSHWTTITWGDVKKECNDLILAVETTMNDVLLSTSVYRRLQDLKKALQTAIRRRNRVPDEVWLCFRELQRVHEDALNGNIIEQDRQQRRAQSASVVSFASIGESALSIASRPRSIISFNGDVPAEPANCWETLSSTLVRCGIELEIYDEETNGIHRMAGVGLGIAVVFAICTVVYYF